MLELDERGRGVVRPDGSTPGPTREARVEGALPGEQVRFLRRAREGRVDVARTLEVLEPAATRVEPRCPHFGVCGGCSLMHLHPDAQVEHKQGQLLAHFAEHGLAPDTVLAPLRGEAWAYRRRARLGAKQVPAKGKVVVGFREKDRRFIADLGGCEILAGTGPLATDPGQLIPRLSQLLGSLDIASKVPQIEVSVGDRATALVLRVLEDPSPADRERLAKFAAREQLRLFLQPGNLASVTPLDPEQPEQLDSLEYALSDFEVELGFRPTDFIQVNGALNRAMVRRAVELLEVGPEHRVLDLFCGLGNFSLALARRAAEVVAIEGDEGLVDRGRANAAQNGLDNLRFACRDLYGQAELGDWIDGPFDRVLLDPPRSGALAIVEGFAAIAAPRVVYVACSPATLARDAAVLVTQHGYQLQAAGIIDMFPHTAHVESIAVFERD